MDLTPYVQELGKELMAAAGTGDEAAMALAERLVSAVESASRLAMLEVLTVAADEITRDLVPGSVEVRLRGRNPSFVVHSPANYDDVAYEEPSSEPAGPTDTTSYDGTVGRINFRPPEQLKAQIEAAAVRDGMSVNAWLVRVTAAAAANPRPPGKSGGRRGPDQTRHVVGWVG